MLSWLNLSYTIAVSADLFPCSFVVRPSTLFIHLYPSLYQHLSSIHFFLMHSSILPSSIYLHPCIHAYLSIYVVLACCVYVLILRDLISFSSSIPVHPILFVLLCVILTHSILFYFSVVFYTIVFICIWSYSSVIYASGQHRCHHCCPQHRRPYYHPQLFWFERAGASVVF